MRINNLHALNQYHKWAEQQQINRGNKIADADRRIRDFADHQKQSRNAKGERIRY